MKDTLLNAARSGQDRIKRLNVSIVVSLPQQHREPSLHHHGYFLPPVFIDKHFSIATSRAVGGARPAREISARLMR
jgi:hypothetical protein